MFKWLHHVNFEGTPFWQNKDLQAFLLALCEEMLNLPYGATFILIPKLLTAPQRKSADQ